ncbi:hypothetical protein B0H14DRAFT_3510977 [Mycena olivaceomarginata]|nr:hypothetical protein B0H14DRAFT_3510977 [Mycena olivaceomarginata]
MTGGKGYTLHLRKSLNPTCREIFERADAGGLNDEESVPIADQAQFGDTIDNGFPSGNAAFEGDYFGDAADYTPEDFGHLDSDDEEENTAGAGGDVDDEGDDDAVDLPNQYEPLRAVDRVDEDIPMPTPEQQSENMRSITAPSKATRKAAEDRFHHKPIVEHYPGGRAGKPTSTTQAKSAEELYRSSLADSTNENPYAPFTSKMDWEVTVPSVGNSISAAVIGLLLPLTPGTVATILQLSNTPKSVQC